MKVLQINVVYKKGSTGKIVEEIHKNNINNGIQSIVCYGRGKRIKEEYVYKIGNEFCSKLNALKVLLTGKEYGGNYFSTRKLIRIIKKEKPDIIHLHNIHGYYVDFKKLFNYIKKNKHKVIWTLHDCWSFTGHCAHFDYIKCNSWKNCCNKCPQKNSYPKILNDSTKKNQEEKAKAYFGTNMLLVTPSVWLSDFLQYSILKDFPYYVINNSVDLSSFKYIKSDFKKVHNIKNKYIILGVSSNWNEKKGFNDFISLSKTIDNDTCIVLVGLKEQQINILPHNIIGIQSITDKEELAKIYSAADILFNPTYEDNYPTINLESITCGTPVATYDTGGATEMINENNGIITDFNDFSKNYKKYILLKKDKKIKLNTQKNMADEYAKIYIKFGGANE